MQHLKKEYKATLAMLIQDDTPCEKCFKTWNSFFKGEKTDGFNKTICGCPWCWSKVRVEGLPFKQVMGLS